MRAIIFLCLALIFVQAISAESVLKRRKTQAVEADAVKTDTAKADTAKADTGSSDETKTLEISIFGSTWKLTWDKWIWSIAFVVAGLPLCFLTISMWKVLKIPMGGIVGFFVVNALEIYMIMPLVNPSNDSYTSTIRMIWLAAYIVGAVLGVLLFWCCPKVSIGASCATLLYIFGLQFNGWLYMMYGTELSGYIYLSIGIAWAVGGLLLGCYFPNFTMMIGTACAGAFLAVVGVGIMTEQYPGKKSIWLEHSFIWWMYFTAQVVLSVFGYVWQHCWGYSKHGHRVDYETEIIVEIIA